MSERGFVDYYRILQVDPDADPEVIEAAFKRLARKYHPDVNPAPDATRRMQEINSAYEVLRDPNRRAEYHMRWERACARQHPMWTAEPGVPPPWWPGEPPTVTFCPAEVVFEGVEPGETCKAEVEVALSGPGRFRGDMQPNQGWIRTRVSKRRKQSLVIEVTVDTALLRGGTTYMGSVVFSSSVLGTVLLPVRLTVRPDPRPALRVRPDWLDAGLHLPTDGRITLPLEISNSGRGELEGEIQVKHSWLMVQPDHFVGKSTTVQVTVNVAALKPGRAYTGKLEVSSNGGLAVVPVKVQMERERPPLPPEDSDEYWPAVLARLHPQSEADQGLVSMIALRARQKGWRPTALEQVQIQRLLEESEGR